LGGGTAATEDDDEDDDKDDDGMETELDRERAVDGREPPPNI
jgi:hypothetical protein